MPNFGAKLRAYISLKPRGSHVVISFMTIIFAFCLATTFFFAYADKNYILPLTFSNIILIVIIVFWSKSQKSIDAEPTSPARIVHRDGRNVTSITADPKLINSLESLQGLETILSMIVRRTPLPEPDGLVDKRGDPIPNSKSAARERVNVANERARKTVHQIFPNFDLVDHMEEYVQSRLDYEPELNTVIETNLSGDD